jgi:ATP synthase protein I
LESAPVAETTGPGTGSARPSPEAGSRKLRARRHRGRGTWFGLGMYGLVGWSVVIPTLGGVALGVWIDGRWPSRFSWTLMLLGGLLLGCWNAWYWVSLEQQAIQDETREGREAERD